MKANRDMTQREFAFAMQMRRIINNLISVDNELQMALVSAPEGNPSSLVTLLEIDIADAMEHAKKALHSI